MNKAKHDKRGSRSQAWLAGYTQKTAADRVQGPGLSWSERLKQLSRRMAGLPAYPIKHTYTGAPVTPEQVQQIWAAEGRGSRIVRYGANTLGIKEGPAHNSPIRATLQWSPEQKQWYLLNPKVIKGRGGIRPSTPTKAGQEEDIALDALGADPAARTALDYYTHVKDKALFKEDPALMYHLGGMLGPIRQSTIAQVTRALDPVNSVETWGQDKAKQLREQTNEWLVDMHRRRQHYNIPPVKTVLAGHYALPYILSASPQERQKTYANNPLNPATWMTKTVQGTRNLKARMPEWLSGVRAGWDPGQLNPVGEYIPPNSGAWNTFNKNLDDVMKQRTGGYSYTDLANAKKPVLKRRFPQNMSVDQQLDKLSM